MKKIILPIIGIFILGGLAVFLPGVISESRQEKKEMQLQTHFIEVSSDNETLEIEDQELEHEERELEVYDEGQIYYENMDLLYSYLTIGQVDDLKIAMKSFIHRNIDPGLQDCSIDPESIVADKEELSFTATSIINQRSINFRAVVIIEDQIKAWFELEQ